VLEKGEDRGVPWSGHIPIQTSSCNRQEKQHRRSSHPPLSWAAPAHPSPALPSQPLVIWLLVCQPGPAQPFFYLSWATYVTNPPCDKATTNILSALTQPSHHQGWL